MRKIFLTTLLVIMMSAATALAAGWTEIYTDDNDNVIFFDEDSVSISSMTAKRDVVTFTAKFRMRYSETGRNAMIQWYRDYSVMPPGIEGLSYDVSTVQFKREGDKRYYHISERICYDASGMEIPAMHYMNAEPNWMEVPIASVIDVERSYAELVVDDQKIDPYDEEK